MLHFLRAPTINLIIHLNLASRMLTSEFQYPTIKCQNDSRLDLLINLTKVVKSKNMKCFKVRRKLT
jgi:hypothetical protein